MRLLMKGGIWKNSEDEVLKAAVMKYGLNNWSRVASLLVRKSARQCKARWYGWLDPSVKKIEWSRAEDEKLLHMAKLFPTQWGTIAPVVGRTPWQCLERYEELLDLSQGKTRDPENDPRRLRPGEIDPHPDTRPAKADPVDLDDDERDMLAEARARLANTQGKKAKRKARERQLDEAKRIAMLQKRRELKAAGIVQGAYEPRLRKGEINYSTEVPFEHQPPIGFFAVGDEERPNVDKTVANQALQQTESFRVKEKERRLRQADKKALRKLHEQNLPAALKLQMEKADPFQVQIRSKLALPSPMVSESELIALASAVENQKASVPELSGFLKSVAGSSSILAQGTGQTPLVTQLTGLQTAGTTKMDELMLEARNAFIREQTQTPLAEDIEDLGDVIDARGEVEKRKKRRLTHSLSAATPLTISTPFTAMPSPGVGPYALKRKKKKLSFMSILESLPDAANELTTISMATGGTAEGSESEDEHEMDDDAVDIKERIKIKQNKLLNELRDAISRHLVYSHHLPRPIDVSKVPVSVFTPTVLSSARLRQDQPDSENSQEILLKYLERASDLIHSGVLDLVNSDSESFLSPLEHMEVTKTDLIGKASKVLPVRFLEQENKNLTVDLNYLKAANALLAAATSKLQASTNACSDFESLNYTTSLGPALASLSSPAEGFNRPKCSVMYKGQILMDRNDDKNLRSLIWDSEDKQYKEFCLDDEDSLDVLTNALEIETRIAEVITNAKIKELKKIKSKYETISAGYRSVSEKSSSVLPDLYVRSKKFEDESKVANKILLEM